MQHDSDTEKSSLVLGYLNGFPESREGASHTQMRRKSSIGEISSAKALRWQNIWQVEINMALVKKTQKAWHLCCSRQERVEPN